MSVVEEAGGRILAVGAGLPVEPVLDAIGRLRRATDVLRWTPGCAAGSRVVAAVGHAERAMSALLAARDALDGYVSAALGVDVAGSPRGWRPAALAHRPEWTVVADRSVAGPPGAGWWANRVDELTGHPGGDPRAGGAAAARGPADQARGPAGKARGPAGQASAPGSAEWVAAPGAADQVAVRGSADRVAEELLRRVTGHVRNRDRDGLRHALRAADPAVGLRLAGVAAPVTARCARHLLRHAPTPDDLDRLRTATEPPVRHLLPGLPAPVLDALLTRACRAPVRCAPPGRRAGTPPAPAAPPASAGHPADLAVVAAVAAAVLLTHPAMAVVADPRSSHP